jgi:nitroreductase
MDILELIKRRATVRKYKRKKIPVKILEKILEAGIWSSSIHGFQPWKFVVITNKKIIKSIALILLTKSRDVGTGGNIILHSTSNTIAESEVLLMIYNTGEFVKLTNRFRKLYAQFAKIAELSAISAAIQNIILTADNLGISSCWLSAPLFYKKEINERLDIPLELVAVLTLGYPAEKGKRSPRKPLSKTVEYLDE